MPLRFFLGVNAGNNAMLNKAAARSAAFDLLGLRSNQEAFTLGPFPSRVPETGAEHIAASIIFLAAHDGKAGRLASRRKRKMIAKPHVREV